MTDPPSRARPPRVPRPRKFPRYDRRMRRSAELREGFLSFFESKDHLRFPSFPLVPPREDPSTLFISAGMQPLKPYFSGAKQPPAPRFTTV